MRFTNYHQALFVAFGLSALTGANDVGGQASAKAKSAPSASAARDKAGAPAAPALPAAPVALTVLPSGTLLILEEDGGVKQVQPGQSGIRQLMSSVARTSAMDMTSHDGASPAAVFITVWQRGRLNFQSTLLRLTETGDVTRRWELGPSTYIGVAFNPKSKTLFLVNSTKGEIRSLALNQASDSAKYFHRVSGAEALGPLAIDARRQRLFVGDAVKGMVFEVDLATKRTRVLVRSLGEPAALLYDERADKLYIADAGRKRVVVGTPIPDAAFVPLVTTQTFVEPRGLAQDRVRNLWVADAGANKVFLLSPAGRVLRTVP